MASLKAKRLRIGFLVDDGVVRVQPPIARAVREVVDALKAAGHEGIFIFFSVLVRLSDKCVVFEWDGSSHGYAYELWEKAVLSDGGEGCRRKIEMTGEPLIEGMLVGTEKDVLTTSETHQVQFPLRLRLSGRVRANESTSLMPTSTFTRVNTSAAGQRPISMRLLCRIPPGSGISRGRGSSPMLTWDIPVSGICWDMLPWRFQLRVYPGRKMYLVRNGWIICRVMRVIGLIKSSVSLREGVYEAVY